MRGVLNRVVNKRGVSEVVGYVMLISISFVLAGMVYTWLKFYVAPEEEIKCDAGVSLTIRSYTYNCDTGSLNLSVQNRGLFDVDGYVVRVNNRSAESGIGVYTLNRTGKSLPTGESYYDYYAQGNLTISGQSIAGRLYFVCFGGGFDDCHVYHCGERCSFTKG